MYDDNLIERFKPADRANHWLTAITMILAALSGLALFHPAFFWLTNLFGGGTWTRILHPFIGVVLAVSFGLLAQRFYRDNLITEADREWMRRIRDVLVGKDAEIAYRVSKSGDIVIDDVERVGARRKDDPHRNAAGTQDF